MTTTNSRNIILIGGMPTAGKSTIAKAVAKHFDIPWISTDQIRMIMQTVASQKEHPDLFEGMNMTADDFYQIYSPADVVEQEWRQAAEVWVGIRRFIDTAWVWRDGCVIEGVSILPELVFEKYSNNDNVRAIFLSDNSVGRIRKVVYERGLFTYPEKYSESSKEKEVEWVQLFNQKIIQEAKSRNYPVIEISKEHHDIDKVLNALDRSMDAKK